MSRSEERVQHAMSFEGKDIESDELRETIRLAILEGSIWADKTMLDRACEYLEPVFKNLAGYYEGAALVDGFRKAMENT